MIATYRAALLLIRKLARTGRNHLWFLASLLFIATVSIYDTWLIARFEESLIAMEQNPVGLWLLQINDGNAGVFIRVKLAGTTIVLTILSAMKLRQSRVVGPVTTSVSSFQAGLLCYLTLI